MTRVPLPTLEQVEQLPLGYDRDVPTEFLDLNDHMNVRNYMTVGAYGFRPAFDEMRMGVRYLDERQLTLFTTEHHLRYLSEMRLGDRIHAHARFLARSDKAIHLMTFIVNHSARKLACLFESTLLNVSLETRRPVSFTDDIAVQLDERIALHAVDWPAPVCGVMSVRKPD